MLLIAGAEHIRSFKVSKASFCLSPHMKGASFLQSWVIGLANWENPSIQIRTVPQRPINPRASLTVDGVGPFKIFDTFSVSGNLPSGVHLCPTIRTSGRHN